MNNKEEIIRITRDEATSGHVDDLLKRQMSLRGDPGVTRDRGRKWYYQNWFVFLFVGGVAAFAAWAIIEPFFDDMLYFQGEVEKVNLLDSTPGLDTKDLDARKLLDLGFGSVVIRGERIFLFKGTKEIRPDGSKAPLDRTTIKRGETLGVHVHYQATEKGEPVIVAGFVSRSPRPQSPTDAALTLPNLATRSHAAALLLFPLVAGLVGLFIGAADGIVCRLPRRALLSGAVGLLVGFIGGFVSTMLAGLIYVPLNKLAMNQGGDTASGLTTFGFFVQIVGRGLAWMMAGMAMGLGQGIALRSKRLLLYGLLGGVVGGLLGGLVFDPIDLLLLGTDKPSAHLSRLAGLILIGATVGAMIGVVELLARDAWLRMTQGPLAGKEFLIFKDVLKVGSSPRSDIYLFNDPAVAEHHATIRALGEECEIENHQRDQPVLLNSRPVQTSRLRHGDQITVGRTVFVFQKKTG